MKSNSKHNKSLHKAFICKSYQHRSNSVICFRAIFDCYIESSTNSEPPLVYWGTTQKKFNRPTHHNMISNARHKTIYTVYSCTDRSLHRLTLINYCKNFIEDVTQFNEYFSCNKCQNNLLHWMISLFYGYLNMYLTILRYRVLNEVLKNMNIYCLIIFVIKYFS